MVGFLRQILCHCFPHHSSATYLRVHFAISTTRKYKKESLPKDTELKAVFLEHFRPGTLYPHNGKKKKPPFATFYSKQINNPRKEKKQQLS